MVRDKNIFLFQKRLLAQMAMCWLILPILFIALKYTHLIFTYTGSIPIGFYQIIKNDKPIQPSDIISFCLPDKIAKVGLSRGYLNKGQCKNGSEPLIKKVIAVPRDKIIVTSNHITVIHQHTVMIYQAPSHIMDKHHLFVRRLIQNGTNTTTRYWVYGFGNPIYSWDSRYYGGIPKENLTHRLLPFWVWQ